MSSCFLVSEQFKETIASFNLPIHKFYPAKLMYKGAKLDYYIFQLGEATKIAFEKCAYADRNSGIIQTAIDLGIHSEDDYFDTRVIFIDKRSVLDIHDFVLDKYHDYFISRELLAKVFRAGDFRSGYYRDQTFMFASGLLTIQEFFAQLYAHPDPVAEPATAGRAMNGHYATRMLDENGNWKNLMTMKNSSADISPTAGQMPRLLGLAYASKLYRNNQDLADSKYRKFSLDGNEVAFGTICDASTSEGLFFETINAAGVLQVPMAISVSDDGYGISVPAKFQTTKQSISEILAGFERTEEKDGYFIYTAKGWDYPELCDVYRKGIAKCRSLHVPVLFHIQEMTQPQGHSTSGSHC